MRKARKVIRTQEIVLEDDEHNPRAVLGVDPKGATTLRFHETGGAVRLSLGLTPENIPRLTLTYGSGRGRIQLEANDALNTVGIVVVGSTGKIQLVIGVADSGTPVIGILGRNGWAAYPAPQPPGERSDGSEDGVDWDALLRDGLNT